KALLAVARVVPMLGCRLDDAEGLRIEKVVGVDQAVATALSALNPVWRRLQIDDAIWRLGEQVVRRAGARVLGHDPSRGGDVACAQDLVAAHVEWLAQPSPVV